MGRIYLDYAATTPVHPDVVQAMSPYFTDIYGNPSSLHCCGQEAKQAVEGSRSLVAALINAYSDEIIFTSGGTESDNTAITGIAYASKSRGNHIITSSIEHHAVLETCHFLEKSGFTVTYLPVDKYGMVSPEDVKKTITDKTILISIMMANNEVGTIEPVSEIGVIAKDGGICFHSDAVQAVGHIPVNVEKLGVDLLSISAHKLYGPKGIGALYIRRGTKIQTYLHGGNQERLLRAGTENVPGIVGFGKAAAIAHKELHAESDRLTALRDKLIDGLKERVDNFNLNGHPVKRLPGNVNISVEFVEGESMLLSLDLAGICVSTGSACSSASLEPSHVLMAMGLSAEQAHGSLRFSMGKWTTENEIENVLEKVPGIISRLRAASPLSNIKR
jgi:cysteine desulfurase